MKSTTFALASAAVLLGASVPVKAFNLAFRNNCGFDVWPGVGKAPNGQVDGSVAYGVHLAPQGTANFGVDDHQIGIRSWARLGCDGNGDNCQSGHSLGGLTPTDAGINAGVLYSEFGFGDFGAYGGQRISWDLSHVDASINVDTSIVASSGNPNSATCRQSNCPADQAYDVYNDYAADRNSDLGSNFQITYCP
ncbi:Osmotin thaumatin-like protein [Ceraceosorus guamensis]|uniref:Osmotin thaumatin-like protein n=1 Tax=Ceraceosorus guamensis TaxID=1522189 RepID=A0A316W8D9_9BASI|nr:Osmotin thaumatin-like protein [Ceraceosorus guamensis]PWN46186.1 Osmotin thaumatin-like protein [Ceraceosorus guamensis]